MSVPVLRRFEVICPCPF